MKRCTLCGEIKPLDEFYKNKGLPDGHGPWCYECKRERDRLQKRKRFGFKPKQPAKPKPGPSHKIWVKECEETGQLFIARNHNTRFSKEGAMAHNRRRSREIYNNISLDEKRKKWLKINRYRKCSLCGKEYDFIGGGTKMFCSNECSDIARRINESNHKTHRKRARHFGVEYESISKLNVFKRDRWRCQHCGIKVQKKDWMKDNAAELDHILPMSQGGGHLYHNVQTLCRKCNNEKGNKTIGQLRMVI